MTFQKLSQYFERLEETPSRLTLIDILSELFSELKPEEVPMVSYLIQGRVAPFYEPVEIGMAEKSVASSIARAFGVDREDVLKLYGRVGDLGKAALELSSRHSGNPAIAGASRIKVQKDSGQARMTIKEVFEKLRNI